MTLFKFFDLHRRQIISRHKRDNNTVWKIGEWKEIDGGKIECWEHGFQCASTLPDAFYYGTGTVLAIVEGEGEHDISYAKQAWFRMRIIRAYRWTKQDSVKLSALCARLVLPFFENRYPDDPRPRKAVELALHWTMSMHNDRKVMSTVRKVANDVSDATFYDRHADIRDHDSEYYAAYAAALTACHAASAVAARRDDNAADEARQSFSEACDAARLAAQAAFPQEYARITNAQSNQRSESDDLWKTYCEPKSRQEWKRIGHRLEMRRVAVNAAKADFEETVVASGVLTEEKIVSTINEWFETYKLQLETVE